MGSVPRTQGPTKGLLFCDLPPQGLRIRGAIRHVTQKGAFILLLFGEEGELLRGSHTVEGVTLMKRVLSTCARWRGRKMGRAGGGKHKFGQVNRGEGATPLAKELLQKNGAKRIARNTGEAKSGPSVPGQVGGNQRRSS